MTNGMISDRQKSDVSIMKPSRGLLTPHTVELLILCISENWKYGKITASESVNTAARVKTWNLRLFLNLNLNGQMTFI